MREDMSVSPRFSYPPPTMGFLDAPSFPRAPSMRRAPSMSWAGMLCQPPAGRCRAGVHTGEETQVERQGVVCLGGKGGFPGMDLLAGSQAEE